MMGDMATAVVEQAVMVDAVEERVDATLASVQAGNKELVTAAKYQSSYRRKAFLACLCVVALIGVIVIPIVIHYLPAASAAGSSGGGGGGGTPTPPPTARLLR